MTGHRERLHKVRRRSTRCTLRQLRWLWPGLQPVHGRWVPTTPRPRALLQQGAHCGRVSCPATHRLPAAW